MAENNQNTSQRRRKAQSNNTVPLTDILFLTLKKWPWILVSLAVCVGGAMLYTLRTPTVYTRAAAIMIKDSSKGNSAGMDELANMGLISSNTNVTNEITNIKSGDLMAEVVSRLDLDINYYSKGRFHNVVAYGTSLPVNFKIVDYPSDGALSLDLNVSPKGEVTLSNIKEGETEYPGTFEGNLGDSISTPLGLAVVGKSNAFYPGKEIELEVEKIPVSVAQAIYSGNLGVSQSGENSSVIRLTMSDRSIQRADDVLSTLIDVYKDSWVRDRNEIAVSTSKFINERLGVIESELGNVDNDISSFKSEHLIPDIQAASSMYMAQNQQIANSISAINNEIQMARFVRAYLVDEASRNQLLPENSGLVGDIAKQVGEYNNMLLQRNTLVDKSSESNPLIVTMDQQLAALRNAIVTTVDTQIAALYTQLRSLQSTQSTTTSKLANNPAQAKYLLSVERQQKVKESLYLFLLQKREENELSQAFTAYNTRIIKKPGPAGVPPTPAKTSIVMMAGLIGLALPFAIVFMLETMNTRIKGRKDIEHLPLPFLGEIPLDAEAQRRKAEKETNMLVVKDGKRDVVNEAFRVLRTNVEFMSNTESGAVIAMTSFNPGSGKSFITMNLGMSMAIKSKKVLIIDGDMRHGSTSSYIGSPELGLSNYLSSGNVMIEDIIYKDSESDNLDIMPIGAIPPNPTELLESHKFGEMLKKLRPEYDYIFIDCPPIEIVADAQIIDRYVDRTIFVVRAGLLEKSMLSELENIYEDRKYHNMALILNGTALANSRYGYSHGYRHGYGYGNSYAYGGKKK